ncbi:MAG: 2-oxoacid:acceptor oxidoreductase subunit alpha [Micromonosporaceae bacterium]|nr:2-oxoacid:acceptor oxidoreductase subunit alpha [Micromonosporaceae bacterium]
MSKQVRQLDRVVIRFAGDSGDGMQLTGDRFTSETARLGNDISTLPSFPSEIRAPAGTIPGVSSFQVHFANFDILTPGDAPTLLIAMNPAALKANLPDLAHGAGIIVNTDEFTKRNLAKVGYTTNPLEDGSLDGYVLHPVALTSLTVRALEPFDVSKKQAERAKNMFALGLLTWLYSRSEESTIEFLRHKFAAKPQIAEANIAAFKAGWNFGETTEDFVVRYEVKPAGMRPGSYRNITGNAALALGLTTAGVRAKLPVVLGAYPITPATDILHELAKHKRLGVATVQMEDEIAAAGVALGASYGGSLGVTATSGPGFALKSETISLGVMLELPMVIVDVQRGGPSTGMPTKTEQADLDIALYGRHGEAPLPVLAARSPADCFDAAIEAARIALTYRTPVILLSDGYIANGSEPWRLPDVDELPDLSVSFASAPNSDDGTTFLPYLRDPVTMARPWAIPGVPGLEHRIGGLEKADRTGACSHDPDNHHRMVETRAARIEAIKIPPLQVDDPDGTARILVLGWGSTYGPVGAACRRLRQRGIPIAQAHLRHLNPMPINLGDVLSSYDRVIIPEVNLGQLAKLIRARYLVDVISYNQVRGMPFTAAELERTFEELVLKNTVEEVVDHG